MLITRNIRLPTPPPREHAANATLGAVQTVLPRADSLCISHAVQNENFAGTQVARNMSRRLECAVHTVHPESYASLMTVPRSQSRVEDALPMGLERSSVVSIYAKSKLF